MAHIMQPYPHHLVKTIRLADGTEVTIRPIRAADAEIEQQFVRGLSAEARYFRFMEMLRELSPLMLKQMTEIDYHDQMALVAAVMIDHKEQLIAVARYVALPGDESCEFAIVVGDGWQRKGLASELMRLLMETARARGLKKMFGEVLSSNIKMLQFVDRLGFHAAMDPRDVTQMRVTRDLDA